MKTYSMESPQAFLGQPFDRVNYHYEIPTKREVSPRNYITCMGIFVTDENMEIINFSGLPLRFELEIV